MKATLVPDIRRFQLMPGAVEFNATQRTMFWTCPCGCGLIGDLDLFQVVATRDPIEVRQLVVAPDGNKSAGDLLLMGLIVQNIGCDELHWQGTLENGEWEECGSKVR